MTIKVLYTEKDFFNNTVQMEAECRDPEIGNIKKAFAYLKKIMMLQFMPEIILFIMIAF